MASNFDDLLSGAWKRGQRQKPDPSNNHASSPPVIGGKIIQVKEIEPGERLKKELGSPAMRTKSDKSTAPANLLHAHEPNIVNLECTALKDEANNDPVIRRKNGCQSKKLAEFLETEKALLQRTVPNDKATKAPASQLTQKETHESNKIAACPPLIELHIIKPKETAPKNKVHKDPLIAQNNRPPKTPAHSPQPIEATIIQPKSALKDDPRLPLTQTEAHESDTFASSTPSIETHRTELKNNPHKLSHPDPTRISRRAALIRNHDAKAKESSIRRDAEIKAAKERHLFYIHGLDDELEKNLIELDNDFKRTEHDQGYFESTIVDLDSHTTRKGRCKQSTSNFDPKQKIAPTPIRKNAAKETKPTRIFVPFRLPPSKAPRQAPEELTLPDSQYSASTVANTPPTTIANSTLFKQASFPSLRVSPNSDAPTRALKVADTSTPASFTSETNLSQSLMNIEASNFFMSETPLKRKSSLRSPSPNKKARPTTGPATPSKPTCSTEVPSYIETDPIRPKLTAYPFCFVSAWNVDIKDENLKLMRKMVEAFKFYPEAVRVDKTGYFVIFEASQKGEAMAEKCGKHFKKWKFRKQHMYMQFYARGSALDEV